MNRIALEVQLQVQVCLLSGPSPPGPMVREPMVPGAMVPSPMVPGAMGFPFFENRISPFRDRVSPLESRIPLIASRMFPPVKTGCLLLNQGFPFSKAGFPS